MITCRLDTPARTLLAGLALYALASACSTADEAPTRRAEEPAAVGGGAPAPWTDGISTLSNDGTYRVVYRTLGDGPIERGETFALEVWVLDPAGERSLTDVDLHADAAMPQHGHGMNREPGVSTQDDGSFEVEGMLFHMVGRWELYLDVTRGPLTERAQFEVMLE